MKTFRLALLAGALAGSALIVTAGPGPQFWSRPAAPKPLASPAVATVASPAPTACVTCACCKKG